MSLISVIFLRQLGMDNKIIIFHILEFTECGMKKNARMPPIVNVIEAMGDNILL
jgi:hypothetical protein